MIPQNDLTKLEDGLRTEIRTSETNIRMDLTKKIEAVESMLQTEIKASGNSIRTDLTKKIDYLEQKIEDTRRFLGILHEETLHKLDLVLEGFQPFTEKAENHGRRIENLENRVTVIEMVVKSK